MPSLIDRDKTREREIQYPDTAGNALRQVGHSIIETHTASIEKYIDWVQELLKRDDVVFGVKMAILGGADPLAFGGSIPAVMMAKLEPVGVTHAKISGGMTVSESNKATEAARTNVVNTTEGGVGTAFWHVNDQLKVTHDVRSEQSRQTDYRGRFDWEVEMGPMGEPEGVGLIKEAVADAFSGVMKINQTIVDAHLKRIKGELKQNGLPNAGDADQSLSQTDFADEGGELGGGLDDLGGLDDPGTGTQDSGTGTQTEDIGT